MTAFVALPHSINTGKRKVLKEGLLGIADDLGFDHAKTYLASGNLLLWGDHAGGEALEAALEDGLEKRMGLRTDFMVRSPPDLRSIIGENPFKAEARDHPSHVIVNFLKASLPADDETILRDAITGLEWFAVGGRELYIDFPISIADSVLDRDWKKTKRSPVGTTRNWNTLTALARMMDA
ncbi:DUF1697 domain-containing protein [Caulobacter sp. SL161]|uniref:DUF1697 domain-containing protein n=1 Tax=Caulobacter sp. SL161 TaxID=2995156 RepID=UPI0022733D27|nr:DUF1697 domain-containing protein [Caulobacter sp. SL161]MCY1648076.1 DUF1697 domain-containing protein [Caulobacter sp. SL161]